jgi:acetolactate synthase-1/2/3 large subunit
MTPSRTGGQILVDQLITHGVEQLFCVPGESFLAVLDALHDAAIKVTVCRQEGGAAMMAEAQGKLTGRPGVCFVTRGPGATNASAGVHIAHQDATPLLLFVGQVAREALGREAFQELDYGAVFGSMAKWVVQIDDAARLPELVSRAFHVATSGRPGPVVIALPEDMLTEAAQVADALPYAVAETHPGPAALAELQQRLSQAKRPVVILGGSRWSDGAVQQFKAFAEAYALPVFCSFRRQMLFDHTHPCYGGDLGLGANPKLVARIRDADLVLLVGGRMSEVPSQSYELLAIPSPQQTLVHVYADADEFGKLYRAAQSIHATPQAFAEALTEAAAHLGAGLAGDYRHRPCRLPALERSAAHPHSRPAADGRRDGSTCARCCRPTPSSATARATSPPGCTASGHSPASPASSPPPAARWATACRRAWAPNASGPNARWWSSPAMATS